MRLRKTLISIAILLIGFAYFARAQTTLQAPQTEFRSNAPVLNTDRGFLPEIRPWAELAYFISNILLVCIAVYGAQQIRLLKRDIQTRVDRAAAEKAAEYGAKFAESVIFRRAFIRECEDKKLPAYNGKFEDFSIEKLPENWRVVAEEKLKLDSSMLALNVLELIAMAFVSGVADERVGFKALGRGFCANVATHYDVFTTRGAAGFYQNVIQLHRMWMNRIEKEQLTARSFSLTEEAKIIQNRAGAIHDRQIPPIGSSP